MDVTGSVTCQPTPAGNRAAMLTCTTGWLDTAVQRNGLRRQNNSHQSMYSRVCLRCGLDVLGQPFETLSKLFELRVGHVCFQAAATPQRVGWRVQRAPSEGPGGPGGQAGRRAGLAERGYRSSRPVPRRDSLPPSREQLRSPHKAVGACDSSATVTDDGDGRRRN